MPLLLVQGATCCRNEFRHVTFLAHATEHASRRIYQAATAGPRGASAGEMRLVSIDDESALSFTTRLVRQDSTKAIAKT